MQDRLRRHLAAKKEVCMIPVRGVEGKRVAVLGLGRSGLSAARALKAGGAEPLVWDDGAAARAAAEAEGFVPTVVFVDDKNRECEKKDCG